MTDRELLYLLNKFAEGNCTPEETDALNLWFYDLEPGGDIHKILPADRTKFTDEMWHQFLAKMAKRQHTKVQRLPRRQWWKVAVAAAAVLLLAAGAYTYFMAEQGKQLHNITVAPNDIDPGHDGAILTLADGSTIVLDSAGTGTIARQGNMAIINSHGQLAYSGSSAGDAPVTYNTLTTPRARQYHILLPDGSRVWLNAASSIRYPLAFTGKERKVEITGEAYFEVVHNAAQPFRVQAGETEITDIGTRFNVYAYKDETVLKATLLEGAISIGDKIVQPGQQAQVEDGQPVKIVQLRDAEEAIAWKKGEIGFDNVDIPTLMRQLARWYNVEIVYMGAVPAGHLLGAISRQTKLSDVTEALEANGIHCHIEGNKLIVE